MTRCESSTDETESVRILTRLIMTLSDKEVARLRKLLTEIDNGLTKRAYKAYVGNRTRNIRLMLRKAERREENNLL